MDGRPSGPQGRDDRTRPIGRLVRPFPAFPQGSSTFCLVAARVPELVPERLAPDSSAVANRLIGSRVIGVANPTRRAASSGAPLTAPESEDHSVGTGIA
jgi:hypothetical protein